MIRAAAIWLVLGLTSAAQAQPTLCQTIGAMRTCNGGNGTSTTVHMGDQDITEFDNGSSAVTRSVGASGLRRSATAPAPPASGWATSG